MKPDRGERLGLRKLTHSAMFTLTRQVLAGLLQLATVVLIARVLGPVGNGQQSVALLLPTLLATLLNLGIGPANAYYIGSRAVDGRTVLQTVLQLTWIISAIGVVFGGLGISVFGAQIFPGVPQSLLWVALAMFPLALFQTFISSIFQGLQEFRTFNLVLLTQPVVTLILVAVGLLAFPDVGVEIVMAAYLVGYAATVGVSLPQLRNIIRDKERAAPAAYGGGYTRTAISYGYKAHLSNIISFVNYRADIFLINYLINPAAAGLYSIAVQMVERLWLLSQAVSTVLLPRLSELAHDDAKRNKITPIVCRGVIASTALGSLVVGALAYPLLVLLFGREYLPSLAPLLLLLPGIVAGAGARVLANDIAARGRPELNMYFSLITVTINVVGNLLLIPLYGVSGASVATTIAYSVNLGLRMAVYASMTGNRWAETLIMRASDVTMLATAFKRR